VRAEVFCNKTPAELSAAMEGRSVTAVVRKGKYFWFLLSGEGPAVLFHFGMAGHLAVKGVDCAKYVRLLQKDGAPQWPPRFTKMQILFNDGTAVAFCDSRRCGGWRELAPLALRHLHAASCAGLRA